MSRSIWTLALLICLVTFHGCKQDCEEMAPCAIEGGDLDKDGICADVDCDDENPAVYIGATCDDGDPTTVDDKFTEDCDCAGTPTECTGIGDADGDGVCTDVDCDDSDQGNTEKDQDGDGVCTPHDCDDSDSTWYVGASCDDGNPFTESDAYNEDCECAGVPLSGTCDGLSTFTDPRDGQTYNIIQIGDQCWFAEDLNYAIGNSWCYDNNTAYCNIYGRLYNWQTALTACPAGWHLPTDAEWTQLTDYLGGWVVAGGKMKEAGLAHWDSPNTGATNESGFTGLPGGLRFSDGFYSALGYYGIWWSATEGDATNAWFRSLYYSDANVYRSYGSKGSGLSVRCVRD